MSGWFGDKRTVDGANRLAVRSAVRISITRLTSADVPDLASRLHDGNLGQRILAALLRPAVAVARGAQKIIGTAAEKFAPKNLGGVLTKLADAFSSDIPLPSPPAPPKKLQFDFSEDILVSAGAVDLGGFALLVDRKPSAVVLGFAHKSGHQTIVTALAITKDFRNPTFAWTPGVEGAQIIGPANGSAVDVSYPFGAPLLLRVTVGDDDGLSLTIDGQLRNFHGFLVLRS